MSETQIEHIFTKEQWDILSFDELVNQKSILLNKWEFLESKHYPYAKDILTIIFSLEEYMANRFYSSPQ